MIVEFLGVSGVGKTYIAKQYKDRFESEGMKVAWDTYSLYENDGWLYRNMKKGIACLSYLFQNPKWVVTYWDFLNKEIDNKMDAIKPMFNAIYLKSLLRRIDNHDTVYLFDEGSLQYLWAVKMRSGKPVLKEEVQKFMEVFEYPDTVVIITANPTTIASRLTNRNRKTRILKEDNLLAKLDEMISVQNAIEKFLPDGIEIMYVKN